MSTILNCALRNDWLLAEHSKNSKETKLSKLVYKFLLCGYNGGIYQYKWIHCIKEILISVGRVDLLHKNH